MTALNFESELEYLEELTKGKAFPNNDIKQTQSPALNASTQEHMKLSARARRRVEGTKFYKLCNKSV